MFPWMARNAPAAPLNQPQPPFRVQYYCPRQSASWQQGRELYGDLQTAISWADAMRPNSPAGRARVLDVFGREVYSC